MQRASIAIYNLITLSRIGTAVRGEGSLRDDRGQTTAEYALVLLGAAAVALLVLGWAAKTGKVTTLLNRVFDSVADKVE